MRFDDTNPAKENAEFEKVRKFIIKKKRKFIIFSIVVLLETVLFCFNTTFVFVLRFS